MSPTLLALLVTVATFSRTLLGSTLFNSPSSPAKSDLNNWRNEPSTTGIEPVSRQSHYKDIIEAIRKEKPFPCEYLLYQPDVERLTVSELKLILYQAYQNSWSHKGLINYNCIATKIITEIVPLHHPGDFLNFLNFIVFEDPDPTILEKALKKHGELLSKSDANVLLEKFIKKVRFWHEEKWPLINELVLLMALYLQNVHVYDLSEVHEYLRNVAVKQNASLSDIRLAVIFASTELIKVWRTAQGSFLGAVEGYHLYCLMTLNSSFTWIIDQLDAVLTTIQYFSTASVPQRSALLRRLHQYVKLKYPSWADEYGSIEDLIAYARGDLGTLFEASLAFYHPDNLSKGQLLKLLRVANINSLTTSLVFMEIFKKLVQFPDLSVGEGVKPSHKHRMYVEAAALMPKTKYGEPCREVSHGLVTNADEQQQQQQQQQQQKDDRIQVTWMLPSEDFFVDSPRNDNILFDYYNLPSLFLYHGFGIPVEASAVDVDLSELPSKKDLQDIANFFGERWCSIQGKEFLYKIVVE